MYISNTTAIAAEIRPLSIGFEFIECMVLLHRFLLTYKHSAFKRDAV